MLKEAGVEVRQGPGCPVCVTTSNEIADAVAFVDAGITITQCSEICLKCQPDRLVFD